MLELTGSEWGMLEWLGSEDYCQYGECKGTTLNALITFGLAQLHKPGEHQSGFIAQDHTGTKGDDYRAVSLTALGIEVLQQRHNDRKN